MAASNEGGLMERARWFMALLRPRSGWDPDSCTVDGARTLLDFLDSWSRGSSWHRCPMLRLIHLVHGLSCSRHTGTQGSMYVQRPAANK